MLQKRGDFDQFEGSLKMKSSEGEGNVKRELKSRHLTMMGIGGTIGTGLFLGMGNALNAGGPLGLVLGYLFMGTVIYGIQVILGEMVTMFPVSGSLTHYTTRFVDPALGFAVGWNYWYSFAMCVSVEIKAATIIVGYWKNPIGQGWWLTIFLLLGTSINFLGVRWFGETESMFAAIKIAAVVMLLVTGIVLDSGGGPTHEHIGFKYWKEPGIFSQFNEIPGVIGRFLAFWSVFIQAAYSFIGSETVALAAAEADEPRKTVPKAISSVFYRILFFYLSSAFMIGLLVPFDEPRLLGGSGDASSSPFVIAINKAGIKCLPDLINACILISAFSATSSLTYSGSRVLYGLSKDKMAPRIFNKCNKQGLPIAATLLTILPASLAYMNLSGKASGCFEWLVNISAMGGLITWWALCIAYTRFHRALKAQGIDRNSLYYKAPLQPYLTYYALAMLTLIIMLNGFQNFLPHSWSTKSFLGSYITLPFFVAAYIFWKLYHQTKVVPIKEMDLSTSREGFEKENLKSSIDEKF